MKYFERFRAATEASDPETARAVLVPAICTMLADGEVEDEEIAQLDNVCAFSPIFAGFDGDQMTALVQGVMDDVRAQGRQAVLEGAGSALTPALAETALCFAARIALADGQIEPGEKAALLKTGQVLRIETATFQKVLDVVSMMQRPAK
ncbi:MAG: tellurite resistance TerB family protein [Pseudomonadota bacterium]